jgi:hypothetical protein
MQTPIQQIEERLAMGITVSDIITHISEYLPYIQIVNHPVPITHNNSTPSSHPPITGRLIPALIGGNFAVPCGSPLENEYGIPLHCPTPPPLVIVTTVVWGAKVLVLPCTITAVPVGSKLIVVPETVTAGPPGARVVPAARMYFPALSAVNT